MALIDILTPDFTFTDDRGTLTQILHGGINQINAVYTKKGAVRGSFHYHKFNKEVFFVISGSIKVTARLDDASEEHIFNTGDMFRINEYVRHSFVYLENTYLVGMYTNRVELPDGGKDIFTEQ